MFVLFFLLLPLSVHPAWSADTTVTCASVEAEAEAPEAQSLTEVSKQLANPVTSFWSLQFQ